MRVAIIGCGITGSAIARLLNREKFVSDGICLDKNIKRVRQNLGKEGFDVKKVDAREEKELYRAVKDFDLIINALPTAYYPLGKTILWNPKIMNVALKAGINYLDLACFGGDFLMAEQLWYQTKFEEARIWGIINAGASPGLTNLLSKENSEKVENVEKIVIRTLEEQRGREFILPWSKEEMLDLVYKVLVYDNRRFKFKEPFSEVDTYEYGLSFGKMYCYLVSNDEAYTLPKFIQMKSLDVKVSGSDIEVLRTLYRLGIFSEEPIYFKKTRILPRDFITSIFPEALTTKEMSKIIKEGILEDGVFGIFVDLYGKIAGKNILTRSYTIFPSQRAINRILPGATYISYPTALCTIAFIKATYGRKRMYGVFPPEALAKSVRDRIISELEKRKIIINKEYKAL